MRLTKTDVFLALGLMVTGTLNTITNSWADRTRAEGLDNTDGITIWAQLAKEYGKVHPFDHPFFQAVVMFAGEASCGLVFLIMTCAVTRKKRENSIQGDLEDTRAPLIARRGCAPNCVYGLPAICDMLGTGISYAGLCLTYPSSYQMLRSATIVFTAILSVVVLKHKLHLFHLFSIVCVIAGMGVVGYSSLLSTGTADNKSPETVLLGNALVVFSMLVISCQMVLEEILIEKYRTPPLKVVGLEGCFGFTILGLSLIAMYYIKLGNPPVSIEDPIDAIYQTKNSWEIQAALAGNFCSIAFFNFFGISVTKSLSASHRMVLDSVRTACVLIVSIALGWEEFQMLQLVGFAFLIFGTCSYNEVIRLPFFYYPPVLEHATLSESLLDD